MSGNKPPAGHDYFPETLDILDQLSADPTTPFKCSHGGGEPAVGIFEVPRGCVALPGLRTQALCPQHVESDGSFEGMRLIIDLSVNGMWSSVTETTPDYRIMQDPTTDNLELVPYTDENI